MNKCILALAVIVALPYLLISQNGLKNIEVERYYITDAADSIWAATSSNSDASNGGAPPVGTVCYRLYANMLPGYKLEAIYGSSTHLLSLTTSTTFFNSDNGSYTPNSSFKNLKNGLEMIDSWWSVGAATTGTGTSAYFGIPKRDQSGTNVITNTYASSGVLQNQNPALGIPLTQEDGLFQATSSNGVQSVTIVGIPTNDLNIFLDGTANGSTFNESNGSIASLSGAVGIDTNKILIGQFTTNGQFCFQLNIQIGTPSGTAQKFVASNPGTGEIMLPSLSGCFGASGSVPNISITSPSTGSNYVTGNSVTFTANASESGSSIYSVSFFVDGTAIGTVLNAPYSINWTSTVGAHTITAIATDVNGAQSKSAPVTITVANPVAPTVSISSPASNSHFVTGDQVTLIATASDSIQTVSSVQFFANGVSLGTVNSKPYSINYICQGGNDTIKAIATNNVGTKATSSFIIIHGLNEVPPIVSITSPKATSFPLNGTQVTLSANALNQDTLGTIVSVAFYINHKLIGTSTSSPFSIQWTGVAGSDTVYAVATDNRGGISTSSPVSFTVISDIPPTISITSPLASQKFILGDAIHLSATTSVADTFERVVSATYYVNHIAIGTTTVSPFSFTWVSTVSGVDTITALATDNFGGTTLSNKLLLNVNYDAPPIVSIASPLNLSSFLVGDAIKITANASAGDTTIYLQSLAFYVNNLLIGRDTINPNQHAYTGTASWVCTTAGVDTLKVVARDNRGGQSISALTKINAISDVPPAVSIELPFALQNFVLGEPVSIIANASVSDTSEKVASVQFFINHQYIGTAANSPYTISWISTILGTDTLTALATDNRGGTTLSNPLLFSVIYDKPSVTKFNYPANLSNFVLGDAVKISSTSTAGDSILRITSVYYYINHHFIGKDSLLTESNKITTSNTWVSNIAGVDTLTAIAFDNRGGFSTSPKLLIQVNKDIAPQVAITNPLNGYSCIEGDAVAIKLTANAGDSLIKLSSVKWFVNRQLIAEDTINPAIYSGNFSTTWVSQQVGNDTLTALVTDNRGGVSTSLPVSIHVNYDTPPLVNITNPTNGQSYIQGDSVFITSTVIAGDTTIGIASVNYYVNHQLIATNLINPNLTRVTCTGSFKSTSIGTDTVTVVAIDNRGGSTVSYPLLIDIIEDIPPIITITSPSSGSALFGNTTQPITVTTSDPDSMGGIASVAFYLNHSLLGTSSSSPYTYNWNIRNVVATDTLTAIATDIRGGIGTSSKVICSIKIATAPTVTVATPSNKATYACLSSIPILIDATTTTGTIQYVYIYVNGQLLTKDSVAPYKYTLTGLPGNDTITALAYTSLGMVGASTSTIITVKNDVAPTVTITSPTTGAPITAPTVVPIKVSAAASNGKVTSVIYCLNRIPIYRDTVSPYVYNWTSVGGQDTLTATATDTYGTQTTSSKVILSVKTVSPPVISITSPLSGTSYTTPALIPIKIAASDINGTIDSVDFFVNGAWTGQETIAPYTFNWTVVGGNGPDTIVAVGINNLGMKTSSAPIILNIRSITTGINGINGTNADFSMYPNPVLNKLFVDFDFSNSNYKNNKYRVLSIDGRVIDEKILEQYNGVIEEMIDVSDLSSGIYLIELINEGGRLVKEFVKN